MEGFPMSFCVVFPLILLLDEDPVSKENLFGPLLPYLTLLGVLDRMKKYL